MTHNEVEVVDLMDTDEEIFIETVILSVNGEIYNHKTLRKQLRKLRSVRSSKFS
ncbi:10896_t:CDS:2 [Dentiscutata heterogama]|uniref:10896_t:CDS:1 n=1 Tax=Dentiscutata heterogama TaxID=1316150 RepID=A0ACA9KJD8_9GLOM|nr:10896_t:CDS:2 [Dentiscutata heterogama]